MSSLGQGCQSRDRCELNEDHALKRLEQYSNQSGCERSTPDGANHRRGVRRLIQTEVSISSMASFAQNFVVEIGSKLNVPREIQEVFLAP